MHSPIHHTRPDGSAFPQAECPLLHTATSGQPVRLENEMLWRRDGTPFFAEYSSFPVMSGGRIAGSVITFSDSSDRQDAQKRLAVQYAVSQILAGPGPVESVPVRILEAIGAGLGWDVGCSGEARAMPPGSEQLCAWRLAVRDAGPSAGFGQDRVGDTLRSPPRPAGRVWTSEAPIHVARDRVTRQAAPGGGRAHGPAQRASLPDHGPQRRGRRASSSTAASRSTSTTACSSRSPPSATRSARRSSAAAWPGRCAKASG